MRAGLSLWCAGMRCDQAGGLSVDGLLPVAPVPGINASRAGALRVRAVLARCRTSKRCGNGAASQHGRNKAQRTSSRHGLASHRSAQQPVPGRNRHAARPPATRRSAVAVPAMAGQAAGSRYRSATHAIRRPVKDTRPALADRAADRAAASKQAGCARSVWPAGAPALRLRKPLPAPATVLTRGRHGRSGSRKRRPFQRRADRERRADEVLRYPHAHAAAPPHRRHRRSGAPPARARLDAVRGSAPAAGGRRR